MKTNKSLFLITILAVSLSACVSKKKYLDMESSKLRAEQRVRELTDENEAKDSRIAQMISDFEAMKTDLMASNAKKDQSIMDLNGQINALKSNVQEKDASIEEKLYAFEYEKRRLDEAVKSSQASATGLRAENQNLSAELSQTKNELADLQFNYNRQKDAAESLTNQLTQKDQQYESQSQQLASLRAEVQKLKNDGKAKDEEIERLKNNVNLLKSQLGK